MGNQDRSLKADAIIFPATITIVKEALPEGGQQFDFTFSRPDDTVDIFEGKLDLTGDGIIDSDDDGTFLDSDDGETFTVADGLITGSSGGDGLVNSVGVLRCQPTVSNRRQVDTAQPGELPIKQYTRRHFDIAHQRP